MGHSIASATKLKAQERRTAMLEARREGLTYEQIGKRFGCSKTRAHAIITEEFARLQRHRLGAAEAALAQELKRLDRLLAVHWKKAVDRQNPSLASAELVLKIHDRKAKLLGLNAPQQQEVKAKIGPLSDSEALEQARRLGLEIPDASIPLLPEPGAASDVPSGQTQE